MEWVNWIYLIVPAVANVTAHAGKFAIKLSKYEDTKWRTFFNSGGTVSGHTATVFSLATIIGLLNGFESAIFALTLVFAIVVAYDSVHVRRAAGEQGDAIVKLVKSGKKPYNAHGHTPMEMILGIIWGALIAIIAYLLI